jgi:hypothetical protein
MKQIWNKNAAQIKADLAKTVEERTEELLNFNKVITSVQGSRPHKFVSKSYSIPQWCYFCKGFLWGYAVFFGMRKREEREGGRGSGRDMG